MAAEFSEHARVLTADHASAKYKHRPGELFQVTDMIAGQNVLTVDLDTGKHPGPGAGCHDNVRRAVSNLPDHYDVSVNELSSSLDDVDT